MLYKSIYDRIDFIRALNIQGKMEGQKNRWTDIHFFMAENSTGSKMIGNK